MFALEREESLHYHCLPSISIWIALIPGPIGTNGSIPLGPAYAGSIQPIVFSMRQHIICLCLLIFLGWSTLAHDAHAEQGCGDGYKPSPTPEGIRCTPIPGLYQGSGANVPQEPWGHWETRWGAYANSDHNVVGMTRNQPSEELAMEAAIQNCQRKGGVNCKNAMTYYNQCALVASGKLPNGRFSVIYRKHYTIAQATQAAKQIADEQGLTDFIVFHSDCTKPEFVRD